MLVELASPLLLIALSLGLLTWSADKLVDAACKLARLLGVSSFVIGATIVAFGTSLPELVVSGLASVRGRPGVGVGNAIGSNIVNIALVLGLASLLKPLPIPAQVVTQEAQKLIAATLLALTLAVDGELSHLDGVILFGLLVVIATRWFWAARQPKARTPTGDAETPPGWRMLAPPVLTVLALAAVLYLSSELLVEQAVIIAHRFGVSDLVIGLTIVAFGTSLPELAATLAAAARGQGDMAIGNVFGSNLFNLLGVLALPAAIASVPVEGIALRRDFMFMSALTLMLVAVAWLPGSKPRLTRATGSVFVALYGLYLYQLTLNPA